MPADYLPKPRKPKPVPEPSLSARWLDAFRAKKADVISLAFDGASNDEKAVASTAIRIEYGLVNDPEVFEALIEWAHNPLNRPSNFEIQELILQGHVEADGSRLKDTTFQALGFQAPLEEAGQEMKVA